MAEQPAPNPTAKVSTPTTSSEQSSRGTRQDLQLASASRVKSQLPSERSSPKHATKEASGQSATPACAAAMTQAIPLQTLPPREVRKEALNPRLIAKAPADHGSRTTVLEKLHGAIVKLNSKLASSKDSSNECFILTPDELIIMALDEEEKVAKESQAVYSNVIRQRIFRFMKMSSEDWVNAVKDHLNDRYYKTPIQTVETTQAPEPTEARLSVREEIFLVTYLTTPLEGLEDLDYVTKVPSQADIELAEQAAANSQGWEKCDRCSSRFEVFPGRRDDGKLTSGGECIYHPNRLYKPRRKKTDIATGSSEPYYPCCSEGIATSSGCTKAETHVFKFRDAKRLAMIQQFERTPARPEKGPMDPVSLDCEMGYTTMGLELIRLTALSWPEGRELLDILVRPMGEILDFNTRFSGICSKQYASAVPYGTQTPDPTSSSSNKPMQLVESPAAARELLFGLLQPETPLIGHAIENDLNACRVIHPTVIDTVLLYPAQGGLPYRISLKTLSLNHLEREIQSGDNGHDSREDALATGDLVRIRARECWKVLKDKGWTFKDDVLVPPPGAELQDVRQVAKSLQKPPGLKRNNPDS